MTIRITIGNVGSGKTALECRELMLNPSRRKTYSNIITDLPNVVTISPDMIIKKEIVDTKKNRKTGEDSPVYEYALNKDFWKGIDEPINVVLDEAHTILNSRRSMHKINVIMTDWMALIRRILGSNESGVGELVLITQLPNRLDTIARDMAVQIKYVICHYQKTCNRCGATWRETSEQPEKLWFCPSCSHNQVQKHSHIVEVFKFANMDMYWLWRTMNERSFYNHYYVPNIEEVFTHYNTLQWDNLFETFY